MRSHRIATMSVIALAIAWAAPNAGADPCPVSCVYTYCSTRAQRDTSVEYGGSYGEAFYDLVTGQVSAYGSSGSGGAHESNVLARDRYTLIGPASSGSIAFTARLHVEGSGSSEAQLYDASWISGSLQEGSNPAIEAYSHSTSSAGSFLDQVLALPLDFAVGDSFELTYTAHAYCSGAYTSALVGGLITFALPAGYGVVSCQGYSSGPVVATAPTSWGKVKVRYR